MLNDTVYVIECIQFEVRDTHRTEDNGKKWRYLTPLQALIPEFLELMRQKVLVINSGKHYIYT